jgi:hypothetical protein
MEDGSQPDPRPTRPPYLRLVWSRPLIDEEAPPPPPRRQTNLAVAIDRQVAGEYGLTNEEFARLFALGQQQAPPPLRSVSS